MGGTPEYFASQRQYDKVEGELKLVEYVISVDDYINTNLINLDIVIEQVRNDIKNYVKRYGIKGSELIGEKGGGGLESIVEIFNKLKENWDILMFILSLIEHIKSVYITYLNFVFNSSKPKISIEFFISTGESINKIEYENLNYLTTNNLGSLFLLSSNLIEELSKKYEMFNFSFINRMSFNHSNFEATVSINHKHITKNNYAKVLNAIKYIKYSPNTQIKISFNRFSALSKRYTKK